MQHQLSHASVSRTIGQVKSSTAGNRASARLARFQETDAAYAIHSKQARGLSNVRPETRERIRVVETALRAAAQRSAPQVSSGGRRGDQQLSNRTLSTGAQRFRKSRIVALISLALVLLVGVAVWLSVLNSPLTYVSQQSQFIPSPVLTMPAFLEATAGESIFLPIALDGTDGVPAHSTLAVIGLPKGSALSKGQPFGDTRWKLERDEIGDLQLVLPSSAGGQAKLTIQLTAPDTTVVADAESVLKITTALQDSLPRNSEGIDAGLAPASLTLFGMSPLEMSPEIARVTHEGPKSQPGPEQREAKPSAAATEEPVQSAPRLVQSQRRTSKTTIVNVGTNEVKTSVFVNLRQAPSPSAEVIRVVAKDTKLRVVARKGRWVQVIDAATSTKGWIYTGNANPPRTRKPSAPAEPTEDTQQRPGSVDTQPKSDSVWPSFLRGGLASR